MYVLIIKYSMEKNIYNKSLTSGNLLVILFIEVFFILIAYIPGYISSFTAVIISSRDFLINSLYSIDSDTHRIPQNSLRSASY